MRQTPMMLPTLLASFVSKGKRYFKKHGIIARFVWFRCEEMILWFKRKSHFLWETPRSKYLLHFFTAADYCWQNDTLQRSGLPLTPWGLLFFSDYPVAHSFVTMQNHSSLNLERKIPWLMSVLERWRVFAQGIVLAPAFETLPEKLEEVKMKGSITSVENLGFPPPPAFQNMLKGETCYL